MKTIKISNGMEAFVDDEDYELVAKYRWDGISYKNGVYAIFRFWEDGKYRGIRMHRMILGLGGKEIVDHADMNGLNNQKANLRVCGRSENMMNIIGKINRKTKYKGVLIVRNKYVAAIGAYGKRYYLGTFSTQEEAAEAYNKGAIKHHGEYARLNKI